MIYRTRKDPRSTPTIESQVLHALKGLSPEEVASRVTRAFGLAISTAALRYKYGDSAIDVALAALRNVDKDGQPL